MNILYRKLSNLKILFLLFLILVVAFLYIFVHSQFYDFGCVSFNQKNEEIHIDRVIAYEIKTSDILYLVNERFVSFSIDSSEIYRGSFQKNLREKKLIRTVSHLKDSYLRVGGNAADRLVFNPSLRAYPNDYLQPDGGACSFINDLSSCPHPEKTIKKFSMSGKDWTVLHNFCSKTGLKLLFDMNVLWRTNNSWNPSNAELLLDFSFAELFNVDWELGNEPNAFKSQFGVEITPAELASDYNIFRELLSRYSIYKNSLLVGPGVTNPHISVSTHPDNYLKEFLLNDGNPDVISWHHYYMGPNATLKNFLDPNTFENFRESCNIMNEVINSTDTKGKKKPVWLGETGTAYGGGVAYLSDRFVSSLLWLDKLGVAASCGISLVVRQSLYRSSYALLDPDSFEPHSDYWISIIYKKLVGTKILEVKQLNETGFLRVYSACSKDGMSPVLYGVNIADFTFGISLPYNATGELYSLVGEQNLLSKYVDLNGKRLDLLEDEELPPMLPELVDLNHAIAIHPHSVFFLKINTNLTVCSGALQL